MSTQRVRRAVVTVVNRMFSKIFFSFLSGSVRDIGHDIGHSISLLSPRSITLRQFSCKQIFPQSPKLQHHSAMRYSLKLFFLLLLIMSSHIQLTVSSSSIVTTLAGKILDYSNGVGTNAVLRRPFGVCASQDGTFALIADTFNNRIRVLNLGTFEVNEFVGNGMIGLIDGTGTNAAFYYPTTIILINNEADALVIDRLNFVIRKIDISTKMVTTIVGNGTKGFRNSVGTNSQIGAAFGITSSPDTSYYLIADSSNHLIRGYDVTTNAVTTIAGQVGITGSTNGLGTNALFYFPYAVCLDPNGNYALVVDANNHVVRRIRAGDKNVTTIAGAIGVAGSANVWEQTAIFIIHTVLVYLILEILP